VEGGGGGLTVSGVSRNRGSFVKCVAIQKRLGIPDLRSSLRKRDQVSHPDDRLSREYQIYFRLH
jgi:hypothetical protein